MKTSGTRRYAWISAAALAGVLASWQVLPAVAQGSPGNTPPVAPSVPCSPSLSPGSPGTDTVGRGEPDNPARPPDNLSGRLAQSGGVICPPTAVDPEIKLPTPETGGSNMPVIPPPGSPGGDPNVRPQ